MERSQAIALVRQTFTERFNEARFTYFVQNLVNHLDETKKQVWTLKKAAFQDHVNHFTRLGTYTDPRGERMDILVIHLRRETTLARGRVTLRNFVADYMTTGHGKGKAAVIAAFVSPLKMTGGSPSSSLTTHSKKRNSVSLPSGRCLHLRDVTAISSAQTRIAIRHRSSFSLFCKRTQSIRPLAESKPLSALKRSLRNSSNTTASCSKKVERP